MQPHLLPSPPSLPLSPSSPASPSDAHILPCDRPSRWQEKNARSGSVPSLFCPVWPLHRRWHFAFTLSVGLTHKLRQAQPFSRGRACSPPTGLLLWVSPGDYSACICCCATKCADCLLSPWLPTHRCNRLGVLFYAQPTQGQSTSLSVP
jgi:hypothetical protein